jgi:hypothetical protein
VALGFLQARWAKNHDGLTRSVRRAQTIAKTPILQDTAQPNGAYEELDILDPNYKKNHDQTQITL